jgi:hypothetical protein
MILGINPLKDLVVNYTCDGFWTLMTHIQKHNQSSPLTAK